jgi:hypothetical protein
MISGHRGQIDNGAAAPSRHLRNCRLSGPDEAFDPHRIHSPRQLLVDGLERHETRPHRVVDQHGDGRPEILLDLLKRRINGPSIGYIERIAFRIEPFGLQIGHRWLQPSRADVETGEPAAFGAKALGDREANPSCCAGDDTDSVS